MPTPGTEAALLQAIHEAPADDAPRLVYADWLQQRGLPRGEFIALQLAAAREKLPRDQAARMKALAAEHGRRWLGPLEPLLLEELHFARGFLDSCAVRELDESWAWATVRQVDRLPARDGLHLSSLRVVKTSDTLERLAGLKEPLPLEELLCQAPHATHGEGRQHYPLVKVLPRLKSLTLIAPWPSGWSHDLRLEQLGWLFDAPLVKPLERLALTLPLELFPALAQRMSDETLTVQALQVRSTEEEKGPAQQGSWLTLSRDRRGAPSLLQIELGPVRPWLGAIRKNDRIDTLCAALGALPPSLLAEVDVAISPRAKVTQEELALLRGALQRQTRLSRLVIKGEG